MKKNKLSKNDFEVTIPLVVLTGFVSEKYAIDRLTDLRIKFPSKFYEIVKDKEKNEYGILMPSDAKIFISKEEKKRLIPYYSLNLQPQFYEPHVYRFVEEKYVDDFFETGNLMLSTLKRCRKLENKFRKDSNEGKHTLIAKSGSKKIVISAGYGDNNLILCTSLCKSNFNPEGCIEKNSSGIEIQYPSLFAATISKKLLRMGYNIVSSLVGPCTYQVNKDIETCGLKSINQEDFGIYDHSFNADILFKKISNMSGNDGFFVKDEYFHFEHEFRFVWMLDKEINDENLIIEIPEARKYCNKIDYRI